MGSCHHGMARPQVANGGTASNMEGSCECRGQQKRGDSPAWGLGELLTAQRKNWPCYETDTFATDLY